MVAPRLAGWLRHGVAAIVVLWSFSRLNAAENNAPFADRVAELYRSSASAVVRVVVATEDLDDNGKPRITRLALSGFFINREGRVLTNSAARGTRIWVEKDGLAYAAEPVGSDPRTNIGLLQVVKLPAEFDVIPLPTSTERLPVGSPVLAVMSPLEFDPTPAAGFVAGYESSFSDFPAFAVTYMRISIPGPPGSGGSPVFDASGALAGITVASLPEVNSCYAVTAKALARIVEDLAADGKVAYGSLPIEFADGADKQNISRQVVVSSVVPDSSAARAGVRAGDVVRRLGDGPVTRMNDVRNALFFARVGKFIPMEIEREGRRLEFKLQVEPAPPSVASSPPTATSSSGAPLTSPSSPSATTSTTPPPPATTRAPTPTAPPATGSTRDSTNGN